MSMMISQTLTFDKSLMTQQSKYSQTKKSIHYTSRAITQ